jgi:hypothetical protein
MNIAVGSNDNAQTENWGDLKPAIGKQLFGRHF